MPDTAATPPPAQEWVEDADGNRCSAGYFGSIEAAQNALDSLIDCKNCSDCSDCSDCSYCSYCLGCSHCSHCSDCSRCSHCSDCSRCSRCWGCANGTFLRDKRGLTGDPDAEWSGPPAIPTIDGIHEKIFAAASAEGALDMGTWHSCGTTHCRAGWAIHLAGEPGYALERFHGPLLAGQLIYRESGYPISPVRFFDSESDALADMQRLATVSA